MEKQYNIDALFMKARLVPTAIPFTESKDIFLTTLGTGTAVPSAKVQFFNFKTILIMIGIFSILSFLISYTGTSENKSTLISKIQTVQTNPKQDQVLMEDEALETIESPVTSRPKPKPEKMESIQVSLLSELPSKTAVNRTKADDVSLPKQTKPAITKRSQFPKLTAKEIEANHKQKKKMIKALSKLDRKKYAYIPSGSYLHEGTPISVQAFHIQRHEVTNLEYRTFIFDLLIEGKKDAFLRATPNQKLWTSALHDSLENLQNEYFSDHKYDDFPVVNISQEGAKMYCNWITLETNNTRGSEPMNDARIPELLEWTYAALNLGTQQTFPWAGQDLANEGVFKANFKLSEYAGDLDAIEQKTKSNRRERTTYEYTNGVLISPVDNYAPSESGLYNMSGNVAEMVSTRMLPDSIMPNHHDENQIVTCGGSWMSSSENLEIFNERSSNHINGHPSIGFRIVVTHIGSK
ncbi:MAG: sulfatase activating formylglycine-generating enzyme [Flavobacteriaceae bacterium]|jgi:formylglycine-generating enzyme required for sulfatase activity